MADRTFTLDEAQSLLPVLESLLRTAIEAKKIVDEAETYTKREDVRGILDGSISRAGAYTIRNVGDGFEPKLFSTWVPTLVRRRPRGAA